MASHNTSSRFLWGPFSLCLQLAHALNGILPRGRWIGAPLAAGRCLLRLAEPGHRPLPARTERLLALCDHAEANRDPPADGIRLSAHHHLTEPDRCHLVPFTTHDPRCAARWARWRCAP
jgi:hypothetical protein